MHLKRKRNRSRGTVTLQAELVYDIRCVQWNESGKVLFVFVHRNPRFPPPRPDSALRAPAPRPSSPPKKQGASAVADRVLRLYAEEEGLDVDGLLPRSMDICHQYLMVLARDNQWEQALGFLSLLVARSRPPPDQNCYDAVLYGLNRAERWVETVEVMDTLCLRLEQSQRETKPRRRLCLTALSTLLKVVSWRVSFGRGEGREGGPASIEFMCPDRYLRFSTRTLPLHARYFESVPTPSFSVPVKHLCLRNHFRVSLFCT